jgi:hypothetical protein
MDDQARQSPGRSARTGVYSATPADGAPAAHRLRITDARARCMDEKAARRVLSASTSRVRKRANLRRSN